ncbi:MAG: enoyl-CoA hydratase [Ectothiorhodospiraceae bacterium]|nr:enoyl-CoA hydratase [Ectothiorhodospiraceae bacterium]
MTEHVGMEVADSVMTLTLDRPEKKNALTADMYAALTAALGEAGNRDDVRVVVLRGGSGVFTAGADLDDFRKRAEGPEPALSPGMRFIFALRACEKPVVAMVQGLALGIGTTLLLHCDFVYLGRSATLRTPFIDLGLCPEAGSSVLLPAMVGERRAAELLLMGEPLDAAQALECGLANAVYADADLDQRVAEKVAALAAKPPHAMRQSKRLMRAAREAAVADAIREEQVIFGRLLRSEESRNAREALQKRRSR